MDKEITVRHDNREFTAVITTGPACAIGTARLVDVDIYETADGGRRDWCGKGWINRHGRIDGCEADIPEAVYVDIEGVYECMNLGLL
jgi:hypothetical protein